MDEEAITILIRMNLVTTRLNHNHNTKRNGCLKARNLRNLRKRKSMLYKVRNYKLNLSHSTQLTLMQMFRRRRHLTTNMKMTSKDPIVKEEVEANKEEEEVVVVDHIEVDIKKEKATINQEEEVVTEEAEAVEVVNTITIKITIK